MFSNPGKVLKAILIAVFIVGCVSSIPLGTMVSNIPHSNGFFGFLAFVGGVIVSYLAVLLGLCFAQLVENSTKIYNLLETRGGFVSSTPVQQNKIEKENKDKSSISSTPVGQYNIEQNNNEWICPKCGNNMPKYITTCRCGEPQPLDDDFPKTIATPANCPVCNFENNPGSEFCGNCGNKLR